VCGAKVVAPDESNGAVGREVGQNTHEQATCCGRITSSSSSSFRLPFDANVEIVCGTVRIANGATVDLRVSCNITARVLWTTSERVHMWGRFQKKRSGTYLQVAAVCDALLQNSELRPVDIRLERNVGYSGNGVSNGQPGPS
jgi:hypothetical protein